MGAGDADIDMSEGIERMGGHGAAMERGGHAHNSTQSGSSAVVLRAQQYRVVHIKTNSNINLVVIPASYSLQLPLVGVTGEPKSPSDPPSEVASSPLCDKRSFAVSPGEKSANPLCRHLPVDGTVVDMPSETAYLLCTTILLLVERHTHGGKERGRRQSPYPRGRSHSRVS